MQILLLVFLSLIRTSRGKTLPLMYTKTLAASGSLVLGMIYATKCLDDRGAVLGPLSARRSSSLKSLLKSAHILSSPNFNSASVFLPRCALSLLTHLHNPATLSVTSRDAIRLTRLSQVCTGIELDRLSHWRNVETPGQMPVDSPNQEHWPGSQCLCSCICTVQQLTFKHGDAVNVRPLQLAAIGRHICTGLAYTPAQWIDTTQSPMSTTICRCPILLRASAF